MWARWELPQDQVRATIEQRREALQVLPQITVADLCEMAIVINATRYGYDTPRLHAPVARLTEMAEVFGGQEADGILVQEGIIDVVNCLRRSDEVDFAGGVFVVVACHESETWRMLQTKGHLLRCQC